MVRIFVIPVPYEWVQRIFGTYIADHFNEISTALFLFGLGCWWLFGAGSRQRYRASKNRLKTKPVVQKQREFKYMIDEDGHIVPDLSDQPKPIYRPQAEPEHTEPIREEYFGQYDRYSDLTDEEMRQAMQIHVVRDRPTFEEWKAQQKK